MRRSIVFAVPVVCLTAMACGASGQYAAAAPAREARAARSASVAPIVQLATRRPADGTRRFTLYMQSPGDTANSLLGTMTVEQATLKSASQRVIRRVITYDYSARGGVIDTTLSDAATLAPISERTYKLKAHTPAGTIFEDFSGYAVTGHTGRADSVRAIHDTLPAPAFNSTDMELVVRSMPLHAGLQTALPIYDPEYGGFRRAELHVDSVETLPAGRPGAEPRQAWAVRVRDTRLEVVYHVDTLSRALLGGDIQQLPHGARYRLVPAEG